jgi:glycosyltransferase involved in cell wall biosynthesis
MRVLVSSSSPPDKGSGVVAAAKELSEALVALGVEVHFLSPAPEDRSWLEQQGLVHLESDQTQEPLEACRRLLAYVHEVGFDGAINNDNPHLQSIAPALPCPIVSIVHMDRSTMAALARHSAEWVDHVVMLSPDMQQKLVARFGLPTVKCPIVWNGVKEARVEAIESEHRELRLVYAGGADRNKGADLVAKAVARQEDWNDLRLDWFGDVGPRLRKKLPERSGVRFHGRVPREVFHETLREADFLLFPSRKEACPMAILEAMSFGVAPITSDGVGAMRWLTTHGLDGFVCQLGRWDSEFLDCLAFLRAHRELVPRYREAALATFRSEFRSEITARRLLELLSRPTVDRSDLPARIPVVHWHRPFPIRGVPRPFFERLVFRLGRLRSAGTLDVARGDTAATAPAGR